MSRYCVWVKFRPSVNSNERVTREIWVDAPNKEAALLKAGNQLGLEGTGIVGSSIQTDISRQRRA